MNFMTLPLRCLSIVGLSLALSACDTPPTMVDQHFGLAVQRAQAQQSLLEHGAQQPMAMRCPHERSEPNCPAHHPHGGMGQGMSHGMGPGMGRGTGPHATHATPLVNDKLRNKTDTDGASALSAVTRYQQSFQTPPAPAAVFNIGLGAATAP
ncbi:hypothetical protein [Limnohabitans sp. Rim8]|uniref:hypothetical protein n=1 Tax=Limnohabitans sp. Rim8 TaxID=1100718 RepID=UPI002629646A|nr:hypothetical protein [Limnohabitans sp. Rim8]